MTSYQLLDNISGDQRDSSSRQAFAVHFLRTVFFLIILIMAFGFQMSEGDFSNPALWFPVYSILLGQFLLNGLFLFFNTRLKRFYFASAALLGLDVVAITGLLYFTGGAQSAFIFLYLITIIFSGLLFKKQGAVLMALWASSLLSVLLLLSPSVESSSLYLALGVNNLAFFAVAVLSSLWTVQLSQKTKDLEVLKDLNHLIVDNIGTGLITLDLDQRISYANRAAIMTLDDLGLNKKYLNQIFSDLSDAVSRGLVKKGKAHRSEEVFINLKNEKLLFSVTTSTLLNSEKHLKGFVVLFQDITQMKRLEMQVRNQEKLAAIGTLAAGIAHEIRNPLASISGSVEFMLSNTRELSDEERKLMRIVIREVDRLNLLITEFLDFTRPETKPDETLDVNRLIQEVLEIVQLNKALRKDVRQTSSLNAKKRILAHPHKLKQALLNIVINAYQAMDKIENPELTIETKDQNGEVILIIRDNGSGIEKANLQKIFEPFHTTKSKGTGLGLAITYKILENHEAKVFVESENKKGTTFTIDFCKTDSQKHA